MLRNNFFSGSFLIPVLLGFTTATAREMLIEGKGALVHSTNKTFDCIYGNTGLIGAEFTFEATEFCNIYPWLSADFLWKKGRSIGLDTPTRVAFSSLGIGLKYFVPICYGNAYLGGGLLVSDAYIKNCSEYVTCKNNKWAAGGIVKLGAIFDISEHFFTDLFINYSYTKVNFCNNQQQVVINCPVKFSNLFFGVGLGYRFDSSCCA